MKVLATVHVLKLLPAAMLETLEVALPQPQDVLNRLLVARTNTILARGEEHLKLIQAVQLGITRHQAAPRTQIRAVRVTGTAVPAVLHARVHMSPQEAAVHLIRVVLADLVAEVVAVQAPRHQAVVAVEHVAINRRTKT